MKHTLANIDGRIILRALKQAKPVTAQGKSAVESYRRFLSANVMTAIALESSIVSLEQDIRDAGLESLVATLKGIMPMQKRKIAVVFEQLASKPAGMFLGASNECMAALEGLYSKNASAIINAINGGDLDAFATVPEVAKLIRWAKSAQLAKDAKQPVLVVEGVNVSMVPVLNLASSDDNMLISVDGVYFLKSKGGALTHVPNVDSYEAINNDVRALLKVLELFDTDVAHPNMLNLKPEILEQVRKALPVKSVAVDLLGGVNELIVMNGTTMDADKAIKLLASDNDKLIASTVLSDGGSTAINTLCQAFLLFERYRDTLVSNDFAYKFNAADKFVMYVLEREHGYSAIIIVNGSVVSAKAYNTIYDLLGSDMLVSNTNVYNLVSNTFAEQLKHEAKKISVKKQLIESLTSERKQYESLLTRIKQEEDDLALVSDVNQDKVSQLKDLRSKTEERLATVSEEIDKLL